MSLEESGGESTENTIHTQTNPSITLSLREESTDQNLAHLYSNGRASLLVDVYVYLDGCTIKDDNRSNIGLCLTTFQPTEADSEAPLNMENILDWEEYNESETLYKSHPSNKSVSPPADLFGYEKYTYRVSASLNDIINTPSSTYSHEIMAYAYLQNYYSNTGSDATAEEFTVFSKYEVLDSYGNHKSNDSVVTIICAYKPEIMFQEETHELSDFEHDGSPFFKRGNIIGIIPVYNNDNTAFEFREYANTDSTVLNLKPTCPWMLTNNSKCISIVMDASKKNMNECVRVVTHEDSTSNRVEQVTSSNNPWYAFDKKPNWACSFSFYHLPSKSLSNECCDDMGGAHYRHYTLSFRVTGAYGGERKAVVSFSWGFDNNSGVSYYLEQKDVEHR